MSIKFFRIRKLVVPVIAAAIFLSSLCGCGVIQQSDMAEMLRDGQSIAIEVLEPSYQIQGEQQTEISWVQLDQLRTYVDEGFRGDVDETLNINIITQDGINGKSGVLYVNENEERDGNTTMEHAFRNKVFINKYWSEYKVKESLSAAASKAYSDVDAGTSEAIVSSINAYYNLSADYINPNSYNGGKALTREEYYSLLFKASNPVQNLEYDAETNSFTLQVGRETEHTRFASEVAQHDFPQSSLDGVNVDGKITRAEAIYMIVNMHFPDQLESVNIKDKAFDDTKNGKDLALKQGFKEKDGKEVTPIAGWEAYTLSYMVQNPTKGMQEELYRAMIVAKNLNLIEGSESRWDEALTKTEAIDLLINTFQAKNSLYGYLSEVEYGSHDSSKKMEVAKPSEAEDLQESQEIITEWDPSDIETEEMEEEESVTAADVSTPEESSVAEESAVSDTGTENPTPPPTNSGGGDIGFGDGTLPPGAASEPAKSGSAQSDSTGMGGTFGYH